jgi:hypothetical protein
VLTGIQIPYPTTRRLLEVHGWSDPKTELLTAQERGAVNTVFKRAVQGKSAILSEN